jgi:hypothetical protein
MRSSRITQVIRILRIAPGPYAGIGRRRFSILRLFRGDTLDARNLLAIARSSVATDRPVALTRRFRTAFDARNGLAMCRFGAETDRGLGGIRRRLWSRLGLRYRSALLGPLTGTARWLMWINAPGNAGFRPTLNALGLWLTRARRRLLYKNIGRTANVRR